MMFDIELERRIGDEFYFTLTREDGVRGTVQLNLRYIIETDFYDDIEWEDD